MHTKHKSFFGNAYLMLTSVIQATAFGFFMASVKIVMDDGSLIEKTPFLLTEFLTIVSLTYGYLIGSRDVWWHLDGIDVLIPYLLGLWEILAIFVLQRSGNPYPAWFLCYLLFMISGIGAVFHGGRKIASIPNSEGVFINKNEHKERQKWFFWVIVVQLLWCLVAIGLSQYVKVDVITYILGVIQMVYFISIFALLVKKDNRMFEQLNSADAKSRAADYNR